MQDANFSCRISICARPADAGGMLSLYLGGDLMEILKRKNGGTLTVSLRGELDHHSADAVRKRLDSLLSDESIDTLALDMRGVTFMDSSGLGVVLGRYRLMVKRAGRVRIIGASKCAERIMRMAGIYSLVEYEV